MLSVALLVGCGGGSSSGSGSNSGGGSIANSQFSLAISDAPVDALSQVVACFNQVQLKHAGGSNNDVNLTVGTEEGMLAANDLCRDNQNNVIPNTVGIDLLSVTGQDSIQLAQGITIAPGQYTQIRLQMSDGSYGIDAETLEKIEVTVPSNELKLDGFTAVIGGVLDYTLEFDLNKAMTNPVGQNRYFLKPRGVRLVDNSQVGHITGTVSETLLSDNQCAPLSDAETNPAAVYLYAGTNLAVENLADNGGSESLSSLASAAVSFDAEATSYNFEIGFVPAGSYTLALTCDTVDEPETDDVVTFFNLKEVTVEASNTALEVVIP